MNERPILAIYFTYLSEIIAHATLTRRFPIHEYIILKLSNYKS